MTGGAYSLSTATTLSQFRLTQGETVLGGLHGETRHHFCDYCKSWLYTTFDALGDFVNVRTSMFDEVPQEPPFVETWVAHKLPGTETGARYSYDDMTVDEYTRLMERYGDDRAD